MTEQSGDDIKRNSALLVARCQQGDQAAFQQLFEVHRADVARIVFRMVGRKSDIDDLIQEVFLQVFRSIHKFQGNSQFSTWLYRVTVNVVLMHRRAAKSRPVLVEESPTHIPIDRAPSPEAEAARGARIEAFYRLLERLSEKKRTVFVLHEIEGVSPAEIAKIVGAPLLTVRTRLFYARRDLEKMLEEEPALRGFADEVDSGSRQRRTARSRSLIPVRKEAL